MRNLTARHGAPWAVALALLMQTACSDKTSSAPAQPLAELHAACVTSMAANVCRASNDTSSMASTSTATTVFVAGVGPVDAAAYRAIRAGGDAMCETVKNDCSRQWDGPQCQTARALWPLNTKRKELRAP